MTYFMKKEAETQARKDAEILHLRDQLMHKHHFDELEKSLEAAAQVARGRGRPRKK